MKQDELAREARRVLEPLRVSSVTVASEEETANARAATLPGLSKLIESVPRERARLRRRHVIRNVSAGACATVAAAAVAALVWAGRTTPEQVLSEVARAPQLVVTSGHVAEGGKPLVVGSRYAIDRLGRLSTSEDSGAELNAGGVLVGFAPGSTADLAFGAKSRRIALNRGSVKVDVPPLRAGSTLSVSTPDAVVTVHGTRFSVEYAGGTTCVRVQRGVVSVMRSAQRERVVGGQSSGCERRPVGTEGATSEGMPNRALPSRTLQKASVLSGTLTQENALFRRALAAEQVHDLTKAEASLERLLDRYPDSPLAGEARRILARVRAASTSNIGASGSIR